MPDRDPVRAFQDALLTRNVVARFIERVGMEHPTEEALKKYLHDHPDADPKNHTVKKKDDESGGGASAGDESRASRRFDENKKVMKDLEGLVKKVENADSSAQKKFDRAYDKLYEAGESAVKAAKKLLQKHKDSDSDAVELLNHAVGEWESNKMDHHKSKGALASKKLNQAKNTYAYAQALDSVMKDFSKILKDPGGHVLDDSWRD